MRISFLLPRYGWRPSGGFSVVYTYAGLLAARGHDVSVVHPRRLPAGGWAEARDLRGRLRRAAGSLRERIMRPSLHWASPDPRVKMLYSPALTAGSVPDGDAVIATWWSTAEAALALPASKGARYHLIQGYEVWNGAEDRVHTVWRAPLHKIFIARWLLERALELGVTPAQTTLIPNAVDLDVFTLQRPIVARDLRVAMLYSSQDYKGGRLGIEMLQRAKQRAPSLTAVLFGVEPAPRLPSWIHYIRGASPSQLVTEVYNQSAVYLCPSLSEGWHLPPAEALACGCALVSSDIGGVHDYAIDGETALLYPPGDVALGADALVRVLLDSDLRMRLARLGHAHIASFSWERSGAALAALLERGADPAI